MVSRKKILDKIIRFDIIVCELMRVLKKPFRWTLNADISQIKSQKRNKE